MLAQSVEKVAPGSTYETPQLHLIGRAEDVVLRGMPGPYVDSMEPLYDGGGIFPG